MITDRIMEMGIMLSTENKYAEMLYAIKKFGSVSGKEALQKIMYFANINSNTYSFQWNKYGPYSEELKHTFDYALIEGTIEYYPIDVHVTNGQKFNVRLTSQGEELLSSSIILNNNVRESIDFAYQILKNKSPLQMELLASVHYIGKYNGAKTNVLFVLDILRKLKPNVIFKPEDINSVIKELKELKLYQLT